VQEGKAESAIAAIRQMLSLNAHVLRDQRRSTVPAEALVPGDIVLLESGDKVPADLRLLEVKNLRVEEAALTGESEPVEKAPEPVAAEAALGDRACMVYAGTLVTFGQARGVVVATGLGTEIGRISQLLEEVQEVTTPLLAKIGVFGRWLTGVILAFSTATYAFGVLVRGYTPTEMFLAVAGIAVAAIPEGLPAVMTIRLAIGVQRMARRNAIIRRLPAVETLGSVTVICSDKTGTLTRNEMTVQRVVTGGRAIDVAGVGYAPEGGLRAGRARPRPRRGPSTARTGARRVAVQRRRGAPRGRAMANGRRPHRGRSARARAQGGARSQARGQAPAAHRCHPVRIGAPLHGDPAPRSRGPRGDLPEGRA
jgi:magnesium-transporting ATPase (P-type)